MVAVAACLLALVPASAAVALAPGGSSTVRVEGSSGSDATIPSGPSTVDGTQRTDGESRSEKAMPKTDGGQPSGGLGSGGDGAPGRGGSGNASASPFATTTTIPSTTTIPNPSSDPAEDSVPADRSGSSTDSTNGGPAFDPVLPPVDATTTATTTTTSLPQANSTADDEERAPGVAADPDSPSSGGGDVAGAERAPSGTPGIDRAWSFLTGDETAPATSSSPDAIETIDPVENTSSVVLSWLVERSSVGSSMVMLSPVVVLLTVLDAAASAGSGLAAPASGLGTFVLLVLFDKGDLMNARIFRRRAEA